MLTTGSQGNVPVIEKVVIFYSQICCIALRVLQTSKEFGVSPFHQSSKRASYKTHVYLRLVHFNPLCLFLF